MDSPYSKQTDNSPSSRLGLLLKVSAMSLCKHSSAVSFLFSTLHISFVFCSPPHMQFVIASPWSSCSCLIPLLLTVTSPVSPLNSTLCTPDRLLFHLQCDILQTPQSDFPLFFSSFLPSFSYPPLFSTFFSSLLLTELCHLLWIDLHTLRNRNTSQYVCIWVHSVPPGQTGSDSQQGKHIVYY